MYGESPDISGGFGGEGVDALAKFLDGGGTLITMGDAVQVPRSSSGWRASVDTSGSTTGDFNAPRPLVQAEILRSTIRCSTATEKILPIKYLGGPLMSVANVDQGAVLARYVGEHRALIDVRHRHQRPAEVLDRHQLLRVAVEHRVI